MNQFNKSRTLIHFLALLSTFQFFVSFGQLHVEGAEGSWSEYYEEPYSNLVKGGQEGTDPFPTYICKAQVTQGLGQGSTIPGKFVPNHSTCYVSLSKGEFAATDFKVLITNSNRKYSWTSGEKTIGENAIVGGRTESGKKLYICRTKSVPVRKVFWSGQAVLIGNVEEGQEQCIASWLEASKAYDDYEILVDARPSSTKCVPQERFEIVHSVRNSGDLDQTITKEIRTGVERRRSSSTSVTMEQSTSEQQSANLGIDIMGIKAGFGAMVGRSSKTGFDWTATSSDVWTLSSTQVLPIKVKAGTHGVLKQLVGICGNVEIRTGHIDVEAKPL